MEYQEVLQNARTCMGPYCKACPVCNGQACKNTIPGPGAKGSGTGFARNYQKWQELRVNLDTIGENRPADTSFDFFGHRLALPVMAAPVGAMQLHYGDKYDDLTYNRLLLAACAKAGIVVSNHGGRVLDQCPATAEVLPAIADAVGDQVMVLVDGGIRTGLDVFKALALGADGVLIGRPFVTMVYGGGEEGVAAYVRKLTDELSDTMAMCGAHSLKEINREMLWQG